METTSTTENGQLTKEPKPRKKPITHSYKTLLKESEKRERKWFLTALTAGSLALMEAVVYWVIELNK